MRQRRGCLSVWLDLWLARTTPTRPSPDRRGRPLIDADGEGTAAPEQDRFCWFFVVMHDASLGSSDGDPPAELGGWAGGETGRAPSVIPLPPARVLLPCQAGHPPGKLHPRSECHMDDTSTPCRGGMTPRRDRRDDGWRVWRRDQREREDERAHVRFDPGFRPRLACAYTHGILSRVQRAHTSEGALSGVASLHLTCGRRRGRATEGQSAASALDGRTSSRGG